VSGPGWRRRLALRLDPTLRPVLAEARRAFVEGPLTNRQQAETIEELRAALRLGARVARSQWPTVMSPTGAAAGGNGDPANTTEAVHVYLDRAARFEASSSWAAKAVLAHRAERGGGVP